eukprot:7030633-Alexandrium_andersonii.AAC.1
MRLRGAADAQLTRVVDRARRAATASLRGAASTQHTLIVAGMHGGAFVHRRGDASARHALTAGVRERSRAAGAAGGAVRGA